MAINRKIGQDSEGVPIYKKDEYGRPTAELDHDLDFLFSAWQAFLQNDLQASEYAFSIDARDIDPQTLKCNPQFFLPELNRSLQRIMSLDGNGFTVKRLGDGPASHVWKGSRWKREDIIVESPNSHTVEYFPPTSVFAAGEGKKYLDISRCSARRRAEIRRHAAREGEILITRSGTIGRVAIVGRTLVGKVLSDDLIRVWVADPKLRALVFAFLRSPSGQDQLRRNEYGTVQQHLEPEHVADLQVPFPDDVHQLDGLFETVTAALEAHQLSIEKSIMADRQIVEMLQGAEEGNANEQQ